MKQEKDCAITIMNRLEELLSKMQSDQVARTIAIAGKLVPGLTHEDILNPDNFPQLMNDKSFIYEDGLAAGILAAKIAVRAELRAFLEQKLA